MSYNNLVKYQKNVVRLLQNSYHKKRLVHTYIFVGSRGSLKKEAAYYLASLILCKEGGHCDNCSLCEGKFEKPNPYVFFISPDGETIKKEQILALEHEFSMAASHERVFIIEHIDKASVASANSLLKFLEDAGENCYGILLTENINLVLPTIISRSQVVKFVPLSRDHIYHELKALGHDENIACSIAQLTNDIEIAINLSQDELVLQTIELALEVMKSVELQTDNPYLLVGLKGKYLFLSGNKEYYQYFIDLLIAIQNDKIKFLLNSTKELVYKEYLNNLTLNIPLKSQLKILEIMMEIKEKMRYNINTELALIDMLVRIMRCING